MLDLKRPSRGQGIYWTSVIAWIVMHGGFLVYVLAYARLPELPPSRPRPSGIDAEVIETAPFAALQRGDREDIAWEARSDQAAPEARLLDEATLEARPDQAPPKADVAEAPPELALDKAVSEPRLEEGAVEANAANSGVKTLADQVNAPLPEDNARVAVPFPVREQLHRHRLETTPAVVRVPAIATPRARAATGMSLPGRRLPQTPAEQKLSMLGAADPHADGGAIVPDAISLPRPKLYAMPEKADLAARSEAGGASASDMGAQGSPVVALLPKEAGVAMFAAQIVDVTPMLPEDRSSPPAQAQPEQRSQGDAVLPPVRRVARLAGAGEADPGNPKNADGKSAHRSVDAKKARAYRANVRAHLAANKPIGGYGPGNAVVAFTLSPDGGIVSVRIAQSSGRPSLDQSVLQSVFRSEPFPKPPEGLKSAQLRFLIPFEFR